MGGRSWGGAKKLSIIRAEMPGPRGSGRGRACDAEAPGGGGGAADPRWGQVPRQSRGFRERRVN